MISPDTWKKNQIKTFLFYRRKTWDEEHVIKRKFSALIPAFDPRPGRTNVNQTSDLDIALPVVTSGTYVLYMVFVIHEKIRMTVNS